ncbi:MAG: collagen binding domain-containing protein [Kofleriaceae bacterium]
MSFVRVVALLVFVGLACWMIWPADAVTALDRDDSRETTASISPVTSFRGTDLPPELSVDEDGNVSLVDDASAERVRIEGIVIDEAKAPIGGATVRLGARAVIAEDDGTFALDDVASGKIILRAERGEWYGEATDYATADGDPIEITVRRGSTLVLHVVALANGAPIPNAKVDIDSRELYTNASGTIRARGLDPTGERFTVTADGFGTWRGDLELDTEHPTAEKEMTVKLASGAPVSGIVVDERGERVPEAWVSISAVTPDGWSDSVSANERGEFTFTGISPGKHEIHASSQIHLAKPDQLITHDGVAPTTGIVVTVGLGAELAGRVVDSAGNPVAGASIRGASGAETDADGRFVATGLEPGELAVSAAIDSRASEEVTVAVAAGKRSEVQLVVRDSSLAGRVVDRRGTPIADAQLWAKATDESNTFFASTDEYGKFDFGGMPPGDYLVIAQHEEEGNRRLPEDATSVFHTGRRDLRIVLPALATVTGRVVLDGMPVHYYGVIITKTPDRLYTEHTATITDDTGTFAQKDIAPGTWSVVILGPGFATKIIDGVVAHEGGTTDLGTIRVDRGRTLTGRVTDTRGRPVPDALVVVGESLFSLASNRVDQRAQGDTSVRTDANGRYELAGLASSDSLKIVATTSTATSMERRLAPEETVADLVVTEAGTIAGHVANMREPLRSVMISLADVDGMPGELRFYGNIDRAGDFRVANVPPGRYEVQIVGDHMLPDKLVDVVSRETTRVEFELPLVQVKLTVHANECSIVYLTAPGVRAIGVCSENATTWVAVAPGSYSVCRTDDACATISVAAAPVEQRIDIRFPE